MSHYSREEILNFGFASVGENVLISRDARIYKPELKHFGSNIRIDDFCILSGAITLEDNIYIAPGSQLSAGAGMIIMEDFASIAFNVIITASSADFSGESLVSATVPLQFKKKHLSTIRLGRHSVVGTNSVLLPGATLGEGTAVGALSLVKTQLPAWTIHAGNPLKQIGIRKKDLLALEKKYREEYPL